MTTYDIRTCFESRFGTDGILMEVDYSQLEIFVLAHITGDKTLAADLLSGKDLHYMRAAQLFRVPESKVTKQQRRTAKTLSFQLQYGAGAKSMGVALGITQTLCQEFIDQYYARYPDVKRYQDNLILEVAKLREPTGEHTVLGYTRGKATLVTPTGRRYVFNEYDNPFHDATATWKHTNPTNFSPTQIKNYPVQGFATGDVVPMVLGEVYQAVVSYHDTVKLINTVHDSILLDIRDDMCHTVGELVKKVMEDAPNILKRVFDIDFNLPLNVEIKVGKTWANMKVLVI